jgi:CGNR zinc finger/Putative stress-induced transcription regulator
MSQTASGQHREAAPPQVVARYSATERCRLQPAPDGLALVQDLLNTRVIGNQGTDLLATVDLARDWLGSALAAWSGTDGTDSAWLSGLSGADLVALRSLRSDVTGLVTGRGNGVQVQRVPATLTITATGELRLLPAGRGRRGFASAIWGEIFLAQRADTWKRLKICHNQPCSSTFFDRSKNNSGVWHDVRICGNAANLRASRARKRAAAM